MKTRKRLRPDQKRKWRAREKLAARAGYFLRFVLAGPRVVMQKIPEARRG